MSTSFEEALRDARRLLHDLIEVKRMFPDVQRVQFFGFSAWGAESLIGRADRVEALVRGEDVYLLAYAEVGGVRVYEPRTYLDLDLLLGRIKQGGAEVEKAILAAMRAR